MIAGKGILVEGQLMLVVVGRHAIRGQVNDLRCELKEVAIEVEDGDGSEKERKLGDGEQEVLGLAFMLEDVGLAGGSCEWWSGGGCVDQLRKISLDEPCKAVPR